MFRPQEHNKGNTLTYAFQGTMEPKLSKNQLSKCSIIQNGLQCVQKYVLHVFSYPDAFLDVSPRGIKNFSYI